MQNQTRLNVLIIRLLMHFSILLLLFAPLSCGTDIRNALAPSSTNILMSQKSLPDTVVQYEWKGKNRNIYFLPAKGLSVHGTILLLHGWNLSPLGWCESTSLCDNLLAAGYNIVIPDMGKSMYAAQFYPETMGMMRDFPQRTWLIDTILPDLADKYGIFTPESDNYIIGLSTGARGAMAIGLYCSDRFDGVVMLSGDYDQSLMQDDPIMTYFYGDYDSFPDRWKGEDNLYLNASKFVLPAYIGHGLEDQVVPCEQSQLLFDKLKLRQNVKTEGHFPKGEGHNYQYWESESDNILNWLRQLNIEIADAE